MSAPTVLGVDPSLTATSLATISHGTPHIETSKTAPKAGTDAEKLARMRRQAERVVVATAGVDLVVIEGLSHGSFGGATRDLAGLWWMVYDRVEKTGIPFAVCAPQTLKKWATGKGSASKVEVTVAVSKRWPAVELRTDDEADALVLAGIGLHYLGALPWDATVAQKAAVQSLTWPQGAAA